MDFGDQWTIVWCRWIRCNIDWAPGNRLVAQNDGIPILRDHFLCSTSMPKILSWEKVKKKQNFWPAQKKHTHTLTYDFDIVFAWSIHIPVCGLEIDTNQVLIRHFDDDSDSKIVSNVTVFTSKHQPNKHLNDTCNRLTKNWHEPKTATEWNRMTCFFLSIILS